MLFSLLVQDEKQREIKPGGQLSMECTSFNASALGKRTMEPTSFNVSRPSEASTSRSLRQNYPPTGNNNFRTNYSQVNNYNDNKSRVFCEYCKKPGHTKDKCFKLHGYPPGNGNQSLHNNYNQNFQNGYRNNNQNFRFNKAIED